MTDYRDEWTGDVDNLSAMRGCLLGLALSVFVWAAITGLVILVTVVL